MFRVLLAGIVSAPAAALLGIFVYGTLTRASVDRDQNFVFRLTVVTLVMAAPFLLTLALAITDRRRGMLTLSGKIGLFLAVLSLGLTWLPLRGLVGRVRQSQNLAMRDVPAPTFDTIDIAGKSHRLQDHLGKVVLINAWATWCPPCKKEMPDLDRLYQQRKDEGFMVFGLSTEDAELQKKFVSEQLSVSYPLLTLNGNVPSMYHDIQKWPAVFLVDRKGQLQPAPEAGQSFEKIEAAVDALLKTP
jgi:peroxiredoxin